ncbi:calcium calmodulin-dependent protein kinase type 1G, partial [Blyttiomyces sp. JEL0837]
TVHETIRKSDGAHFAVKIIDKKNMKGKESSVKSEIAVLQKLHHPNIIGLKDVFENKKNLYLVTDLATGGELFDQIVAKGSYTEKDAAVIVKQLLNAVAYMHKEDVVHRDLKPENLLLLNKTADSPIMITDFGLAKEAHLDYMLKTACGTPAYIAPEVLRQSGHGKPVDVWGMGVITYVLLCGYTPFYGESQHELFEAIIHGEYEFEEEFWSQVSEDAKDFIRKMLTLDPRERPTAEEVLKHKWLETTANADLLETIKKNLAKQRLKKAINAVRAANVMEHLGHRLSVKKKAEADAAASRESLAAGEGENNGEGGAVGESAAVGLVASSAEGGR